MIEKLRRSRISLQVKALAILCIFSSACATTYERCNEFTENPYGLSMNMTQEEIQAKFPGETEEAITAKIKAKTKLEWHRYGSLEACVAAKSSNDAAIYNGIAELGNSYSSAVERNNASKQVAQPTKCKTVCDKLWNQTQCETKCD